MISFRPFEEVACYKASQMLRNLVRNTIISQLPHTEKFELVNQIRCSSRSVSNNIAESFGKFNYQENIQFCRIARGTLHKTLDHAIIA